jgi:hypothetical protein
LRDGERVVAALEHAFFAKQPEVLGLASGEVPSATRNGSAAVSIRSVSTIRVSASLLALSNGRLTWVLAYFVFICALAVGAVLSARESAGIPLPEEVTISVVGSRNPH